MTDMILPQTDRLALAQVQINGLQAMMMQGILVHPDTENRTRAIDALNEFCDAMLELAKESS